MRSSESSVLGFALVVACLVATPAAQAATTATATIGTTSWTFTDLNLGDGITPSISFTSPSSQSFGQLPGASTSLSQYMPGAYAVTSVSGSNSFGSLSVSTGPTGGTASGTLSGSAVNGTQLNTSVYAYPFIQSFTLSPNTMISFLVPYSLAASTTLGQVGNNYESGQAFAYFQLYTNSGGGSSSSFYAQRSLYAGSTYVPATQTFTGQSLNDSGTVELIYANRTAAPVTGSVYAVAWAYNSSTIAAVPESSALSLMVAGLAAVGFVARRRQRRA